MTIYSVLVIRNRLVLHVFIIFFDLSSVCQIVFWFRGVKTNFINDGTLIVGLYVWHGTLVPQRPKGQVTSPWFSHTTPNPTN